MSDPIEDLRTFFEQCDEEESSFQVTNAFAFSRDAVHLCIEATGENEDGDDLDASAIVRVDLGAMSAQGLHGTNLSALNYFSSGPQQQYLLASGGYMHMLSDAEPKFIAPPSDDFVTGLEPVGDGSLAVFGDDGAVFVLRDGVYARVATPTEYRINDMFFLDPEHGFAVGSYGTVLRGGVGGFEPLPISDETFAVPGEPGSRYRVVSVHALGPQTLLLGSDEGPACLVEGTEVQTLEGLEEGATVETINVFQGVEYWGADVFGVYTRQDNTLLPKFETESAMVINASDTAMTIVAGHYVYVFDGQDWVEFRVVPDGDRLVERVELDFEPGC